MTSLSPPAWRAQVLQEALSRCAAVLGGSAADSTAAAVCTHCARCFAVAARFPACRAAAAQLPQLCADIVPLLRRPVSDVILTNLQLLSIYNYVLDSFLNLS